MNSLFFTIPLVSIFIEIAAVHVFATFFFRIGIPVFKRTINLDTTKLPTIENRIFRKNEGKFYFSPNNKIYFLSLYRLFKIQTIFPFIAIGKIKSDNQIVIKARVPLSTTVSALLLLGLAIIASINSVKSSGDYSLFFCPLAIFIVFVVFVVIGRIRIGDMIVELKKIITAHNNRT